jgi:hypothetical protein
MKEENVIEWLNQQEVFICCSSAMYSQLKDGLARIGVHNTKSFPQNLDENTTNKDISFHSLIEEKVGLVHDQSVQSSISFPLSFLSILLKVLNEFQFCLSLKIR